MPGTAGFVEPLRSDDRAPSGDALLDATIVVKDVAAAVVTAINGTKAVREALRWLRRRCHGSDLVEVTIAAGNDRHHWVIPAQEIDDAFIESVCLALVVAETDTGPQSS